MYISPYLTVERFAASTGVAEDVVRGWIARGYLPTRKIGRYRLVDVLALAARADAIAPYLQGLPGSGSDAPAAAGRGSAGRRSPASPAVAPARKGGAAAVKRAGTGGGAGAAAAGRGDLHPVGRLGIPTPNLDNFGGPGRE